MKKILFIALLFLLVFSLLAMGKRTRYVSQKLIKITTQKNWNISINSSDLRKQYPSKCITENEVRSLCQPITGVNVPEGWQLYVHERTGFSFYFPPTLEPQRYGTLVDAASYFRDPTFTMPSDIRFRVFDPSLILFFGDTFESLYRIPPGQKAPVTKEREGKFDYIKLRDFDLEGFDAVEYLVQSYPVPDSDAGYGCHREVVVKHDESVIEFQDFFGQNQPDNCYQFLSKMKDNTFDQILSTVTFQVPKHVDETDSWNTYTNNLLHYKFNFPADWQFQDRCDGGSISEQHYPCFLSADFETGPAGILMGNPQKGGSIIITVRDAVAEDQEQRCLKNTNGNVFPCTSGHFNNIQGWKIFIEGSPEIPSYPYTDNTVVFHFLHNGQYFLLTAYYNDVSRREIHTIFDQMLSTFKFAE